MIGVNTRQIPKPTLRYVGCTAKRTMMRQNCKIARGARATRELGKRPVTALRRFARLAGSERGTSAVEFALAAPVLLALLVPLADFGIAFSEQLQVQQAAQAGAHYAALHPWNSNSATTIA